MTLNFMEREEVLKALHRYAENFEAHGDDERAESKHLMRINHIIKKMEMEVERQNYIAEGSVSYSDAKRYKGYELYLKYTYLGGAYHRRCEVRLNGNCVATVKSMVEAKRMIDDGVISN